VANVSAERFLPTEVRLEHSFFGDKVGHRAVVGGNGVCSYRPAINVILRECVTAIGEGGHPRRWLTNRRLYRIGKE